MGFKTTPYAHQLKGFELQKDRITFALFMDMGTGKSKVTIDTACYQYQKGNTDCLLVLAPTGVEENWVSQEIPAHIWDGIDYLAVYYRPNARVKEKKEWKSVTTSNVPFLVVTFPIESLSSKVCRAEVQRLLAERRCMMVLDESQYFKTPGAKRTRFVNSLFRRAKFRRILSGTAITNTPLDLYSQYRFLHWKILGHQTLASFKGRYAVIEKVLRPDVARRKAVTNERLDPHRDFYDKVLGYRNIRELKERMAQFTYRVRKEDCLDLPPKVYTTRYVHMTAEQQRVYDELLNTGVATLAEQHRLPQFDSPEEKLWHLITEETVPKTTVSNALSLLTRLQQVAGGFLPSDDKQMLWRADLNPKLEAVQAVLSESAGKAIIWTRFVDELKLLADTFKGDCVLYYGEVPKEQRVLNRKAFQSPDGPRLFIGTQATGGTGITLTEANLVIYFSNSFKADHRWQSEDRAHRIGQTRSVTYVDLIVHGTLDERILSALKQKRDISDEVLTL